MTTSLSTKYNMKTCLLNIKILQFAVYAVYEFVPIRHYYICNAHTKTRPSIFKDERDHLEMTGGIKA